ncbi:MAG: CoA-binding protein [Candidatus Bathyarchaeota archaeon]|nr:MAG: CoA-binding protein [Candidatus Bathyarchaeota archaeon]
MSQQQIKAILETYRTVAVVGLSKDSSKHSHRVARYLQAAGYRVIPVNPFVDTVLGEKAYKSLLDVPEPIDIVDIFRPSDEVLPVIEEAVKLKTKFGYPHVVWMQEGIINEQAAQQAKQAGLTVVMDHCMMKEHKRQKN